MTTIVLILIPLLILFFGVMYIASRYKRCPSNMILVVYGKVAGKKSAQCIHGGGAFVLPLIQDYQYLSLEPIVTNIDLKGALSKNNIRVSVPSTFTYAVSTNEAFMENAAKRLLGLSRKDIDSQARDIIFGQLRLVVASMEIEEINSDREKFLELISKYVDTELNKVGLEIINVNIEDIKDESGYIVAIGQKAAAEAIQKANIDVAVQEKQGAIGVQTASKEREVQVAQQMSEAQIGKKEADKNQRVQTATLETEAEVGEAEAERTMRIKKASFEAEAVEGENTSKIQIADYNAKLAVKEAESLQKGEVAKAQADTAILRAEAEEETARLEKEQVVPQKIEKEKIEIQAEAEAEQTRRIAKGQADAILAQAKAQAEGIKVKLLAEAEGNKAILEAKAEGYKQLVAACGANSQVATTLLMIEKVENVAKCQAEAISNIKFDQITVWDSGGSTSGFINNLITSLPALHDVTKMAGIKLPDYLGTVGEDKETKQEEINPSSVE